MRFPVRSTLLFAAALLTLPQPAAAQAGDGTTVYARIANWQIARQHWDAYTADLKKNTVAILDKLLADGVLVLPKHKTLTRQKQPRPRVVALAPAVRALLALLARRPHADGDHVFLNSDGNPWTPSALPRLTVTVSSPGFGLPAMTSAARVGSCVPSRSCSSDSSWAARAASDRCSCSRTSRSATCCFNCAFSTCA